MNNRNQFINADDYCLSENVNKAIVDLANKRLIDSTTIIVNNTSLPIHEELPKLKNIYAGLHLNLTSGIPVSNKSEVKSLINKKGHFYSVVIFWIRFILCTSKKSEIKREITAQYTLLSNHVDISHVDTHKHIHCYPFLGEYILSCFLELGINKIRNPYPLFAKNRGYFLLKLFCKRKKWKKRASLFHHPDGIVSLCGLNSFDSVPKFDGKFVEIVAHPAIENENSYLNKKSEYYLVLNYGSKKQ